MYNFFEKEYISQWNRVYFLWAGKKGPRVRFAILDYFDFRVGAAFHKHKGWRIDALFATL
jgi:hypothetical protein